MSICKTTQGFGGNANPTYASEGQKGHTGVDSTCGYGSKVYSLKNGTVYKILNKEHPARDGSGYYGVFMICREPDGRYFEWQIGHLSKIYCKIGDKVNAWDFIGEEGNRGIVYSGGVQITKAMQDAGDKRGSHRHYNKKYLARLPEVTNRPYLTMFTPISQPPALYRDPEGFYYATEGVNNGYGGSVDCAKDIEDGRKFVEQHLATPPSTPLPMLEKSEKDGFNIKIKLVFNNCNWTTIDQKVKQIKDFYAPKFNIMCDVVHTQFSNIPFKTVVGLDGSSGVEVHNVTEMVDPLWFNNNITNQALAYDMVLFYVTDKDKNGHVTSAGIRSDSDQGPVELTVFGGNENDHAYNQGVDMGSSFAFFACHEIAHGIAMMFKIPDTVHKHFYTANPKAILNEYNLTTNSYIGNVLDRISKAVAYMFSLISKK